MKDFFAQRLDEAKINQIAKETSFCKRIRKLSPFKFLQSLCFKPFDSKNQSLNDHCSDISINDHIKITKQSLSEKFNANALEFLKKVLNSLKVNSNIDGTSRFFSQFSNVYIQDGTYFKLPLSYLEHYQGMGNTALSGAKIMFVYDFVNSNFVETELIEGKINDSLSSRKCDWITPNSLVLRDLGFFSIDGIREIEEKGAFYISKVQPRTNIYIKKGAGYVKLDIKTLVNEMRKNSLRRITLRVYIGNKKEIETTAIIDLMPDDVVNERIRTKKKKGESRNWKMTDEFLHWSHINFFITNINTVDCSPRDWVGVYKLRWQVEIIFKTWKSHHKIHEYKAMQVQRFQCYIYASLISLLLEFKIYHCFRMGCLVQHKRLISVIKFSKLMVQQKHVLRKLFERPVETTEILLSLLENLRHQLFIEAKKGNINQYNVLNINAI